MNGFESELRGRLLSLSAHATLSLAGAPITDWKAPLSQLQGSPGLTRRLRASLDTDAMLSKPVPP